MTRVPDVDWRDRVNDAYYGRMGAEFGRVTRDRLHWMLSQARGGTALDVGCSQGIGSILLAREGFQVLGIDMDPEVVNSANDALSREIPSVRSRVEFRCADLYELQPPQRYDTVLAGEVIEHQGNPARFISKLLDCLTDDGVLVITTPFGLNLWPDHKCTLFPGDLIDAVGDLASCETIEVVGGYIRATFLKGLSCGRSNDLDLGRVLRTGILEAQELYHRVATERKSLRDALSEAKAQVRQAQSEKAESEDCAARATQRLETCEREAKELKSRFEHQRAEMHALREHARSLKESEGAAAESQARLLTQLSDAVSTLGNAISEDFEMPNSAEADDLLSSLRKIMEQVPELVQAKVERESLRKAYSTSVTVQEELAAEVKRLSDIVEAEEAQREESKRVMEEVQGTSPELQEVRRRLENALTDLARARHQGAEATKRLAEVSAKLEAEALAAEEGRLLVDVLRHSIAFQLGRSILDGTRSVRGLLGLPKRLWQLTGVVRARSRPTEERSLRRLIVDTGLPSMRAQAEANLKSRVTSQTVIIGNKNGSSVNQHLPLEPSQSKNSGATNAKIARGAKGVMALSILDEMSQVSWGRQFRLFQISRKNYKTQIQGSNAKFAFLESCWRGNDGRWEYAFTSPNLAHANAQALLDVIDELKSKGLPVVFWNKEDPMHYDRFLPIAKKGDLVLTTDSNMLPRYRKDIPGVKVDVMPFAAEISICNPAERFRNANKGTICFAGSYYGEGHDERKRQMDRMLPLITTFDGVIYDRMSKLNNSRYAYPEPYREHIRPSVPFDRMVQLYRSFKVFLNVNTIVDSPTMMSRRVYELLASGTPVVSTPSAAIEAQFPGIVHVADSASDALPVVERLLQDPNYWDRVSHRGYREVMGKHTYAHRAESLLSSLGMAANRSSIPRVSVVMCTRRPWLIDRICANLTRQLHSSLELIFVLKEFSAADRQRLEAGLSQPGSRDFDRVKIIEDSSDRTLGERFNLGVREASGEYVAKMDDDDIYFPNYLSDMLLPFKYGDYALVGKKENFVYLEGSNRLIRRFPGARHRTTDFVAGPTFVTPRSLLLAHPLKKRNQGEDSGYIGDLTAAGLKIYSADPFNFIQWRSKSAAHTWKVEEDFFLSGQGRLEATKLDESLVEV